MVLALDGTAVLVDLGDRDLNGTVVLGLDDAVGSAALAGDVAIERELRQYSISVMRLAGLRWGPYRSTISPRSFSIFAVFGEEGGGVCEGGFGGCFRRGN